MYVYITSSIFEQNGEMKKYSIAYDSIDMAIEYVSLDIENQYGGQFASAITEEIRENIRMRGDFYYRYGDAVHYIMIEKMEVYNAQPENVDNVVTFACTTTSIPVSNSNPIPLNANPVPVNSTPQNSMHSNPVTMTTNPMPVENETMISYNAEMENELNQAIEESNNKEKIESTPENSYIPQPESIGSEKTLTIANENTNYELNNIINEKLNSTVPASFKGARRTRRKALKPKRKSAKKTN